MTKRYLKTPEEVINALKEGKTIETDRGLYALKDGLLFCSRAKKSAGSWWSVNTPICDIDSPYIDEPEPLKLEVGKFYKTRDGRKAWVVECTDKKGAFPFMVAAQKECNVYSVAKDGRRYFDDTDETDLVAPWEEQ